MALANTARYVLAAEFLMGGQSRITPLLTPSIHKYVMEKASHFFRHLQFIPGQNPQAQMQSLGAMMCLAAAWLAAPGPRSPAFRRGAVLLGGSLSSLLLVGEYTIGGDVWLPAINIALAGWLFYYQGGRVETSQ